MVPFLVPLWRLAEVKPEGATGMGQSTIPGRHGVPPNSWMTQGGEQPQHPQTSMHSKWFRLKNMNSLGGIDDR